ncbi:hypothetical protein DFQ28_003168 [Apophysomyces sp. BC1034]|nr:hypothetical protein DFQ30_011172 [Apophysomyces sp. BC1015]KAG0179203.1 hypothetical protein DFQ29_002396 [Apophysomyces sp. BC1021]KAG0189597.1 hypothetical protein DFQ28_003168 [Apophysomyces sp. BC1034]
MTASSISNGQADEQTGLLNASAATYTLEVPDLDQFDPTVSLDKLTDTIEEILMRDELKQKKVPFEVYQHATDRWLNRHQHGLLARYGIVNQDIQANGGSTAVCHEIWQVGKNASACGILALLAEQRLSDEKDDTVHKGLMQQLALSTLRHAMDQTSATEVVKKEMLIKPWVDGKSALELAIENNCQIFLADSEISGFSQTLWRQGRSWRDTKHPSSVWDSHEPTNRYETFFWLTSALTQFFTRWAAARYQAYISLFTGLVYFALQLATAANEDYVDTEPRGYEYVYYGFVISDILLELGKLFRHPIRSVETPSTYLSLTTSVLVFTAFVLRFVALDSSDLEDQIREIEASYMLVIWATPLMAFRLSIWANDLWWPVTKVNYVLKRCLTNTLWVISLSLAILGAFWVGLYLLQRNEVQPLTMLLNLALGELHTPRIGDTLIYKPYPAGVLLFLFMVLTMFTGALVISSFLAVFIEIYPRLGEIRRITETQRSIREQEFGVFIPGMGIEILVFGIGLLLRPFQSPGATKHLEQFRQVLWYIVYSPIILTVGVVEILAWGGSVLCKRCRAYRS